MILGLSLILILILIYLDLSSLMSKDFFSASGSYAVTPTSGGSLAEEVLQVEYIKVFSSELEG